LTDVLSLRPRCSAFARTRATTPGCSLTRNYEYGGRYDLTPADLADDQIVTVAREQFFDGRGNRVQKVEYGQVDPVGPYPAVQVYCFHNILFGFIGQPYHIKG